jgi:hypothetical protein
LCAQASTQSHSVWHLQPCRRVLEHPAGLLADARATLEASLVLLAQVVLHAARRQVGVDGRSATAAALVGSHLLVRVLLGRHRQHQRLGPQRALALVGQHLRARAEHAPAQLGHLRHVAPAADEDEHMARQRVLPHAAGHDLRQRVDGLAHVHGLAVDVGPDG